ncbi:hypothetical protein DSO57_1014472 [Entomophthora muscae]|uniref:Uncharacterized protein n=1 Tax=Entomophthora muscae TaxID=34485 RepID=A0ACC2RWK1_9FUNG|nr:hypothetical protein DSO57_1014472 [Entomophthora muscae]
MQMIRQNFFTLNKDFSRTILPYMEKNLRLSYLMPKRFNEDVLPKIGSHVCKLEIANLDLETLKYIPNVKKISVLEDYHESLDEDILLILQNYPNLLEIDLSKLCISSEIIPHILDKKKLVVLNLPDIFEDYNHSLSFIQDLITPSLRTLTLAIPRFSCKILAVIAKNLPNLNSLIIEAHKISGDRKELLNSKLQRLKTFEVHSYSDTASPVTFRPENLPSLTSFSSSLILNLKVSPGCTLPPIKNFMFYRLNRHMISSIQENYPGFSSIVLVCHSLSSQLVCEVLKHATTLEKIHLHHVSDKVTFNDLPIKDYKVLTFSLTYWIPVQPDFFSWMASSFPLLHCLSIEVEFRRTAIFDAIPFDSQASFACLAVFQAGGCIPAIWLHQIVQSSPKLDILEFDSQLSSLHSRRFSSKYPCLSVLVGNAFNREQYREIDFDSETNSESYSDQESISGFATDPESEFNSNSELVSEFDSDSE